MSATDPAMRREQPHVRLVRTYQYDIENCMSNGLFLNGYAPIY